MTILKIDNLSKSFFSPTLRESITVLEEISLTVSEGEFISIFGPNGCGKTTLLKVAAGLEKPDSGKIVRNWSNIKPLISPGFVFQNYSATLLPWETAIDNIAFPLLSEAKDKSYRRSIAKLIIDKLCLDFDVRKYPYQLSGGEQQLCCFARAIVHNPKILFLDEPFSALDIRIRRRMQEFIVGLWGQRRLTIIMISHDLDEAILLASRFILLGKQPGKVKLDMPIDLSYPRTLKQIESEEFFHTRNNILAAVRKEAEI
jgi:ABC-type nitrate/sulfonate/bicarbonate transport system ATPase subunit